MVFAGTEHCGHDALRVLHLVVEPLASAALAICDHLAPTQRLSLKLPGGTVHDEHMKELESLILRIVEPKGNRVAGKFARSEGLRRKLNRAMRERDADRRADLLGGHVARRRHRTKVKHSLGANRLAGIAGRAVQLRRRYKEEVLKASLLKDGRIRVAGKLYDSPNAAARAATGRRQINGWFFWHFRNDKKEWVPLRSLRDCPGRILALPRREASDRPSDGRAVEDSSDPARPRVQLCAAWATQDPGRFQRQC